MTIIRYPARVLSVRQEGLLLDIIHGRGHVSWTSVRATSLGRH